MEDGPQVMRLKRLWLCWDDGPCLSSFCLGWEVSAIFFDLLVRDWEILTFFFDMLLRMKNEETEATGKVLEETKGLSLQTLYLNYYLLKYLNKYGLLIRRSLAQATLNSTP